LLKQRIISSKIFQRFDLEAFIKWRIIDPIFSSREYQKIKNKDFSIICNSCLAGGIYHKLGSQYTTPTVGLFFLSEDYIKFLENFEYYIGLSPTFQHDSKHNHPVGILDDIEIHFLHYKTEQEVEEKWNRRKERINFNNLFFIYSDGDEMGFQEEYFERYAKLPFERKLFFSGKPRKSSPDCTVIIRDWFDATRSRKYEKYIDIIKWLNKEKDFVKEKYREKEKRLLTIAN
jgi:uncharacterized protein (DUF1919 family)